MKSPQILAKVKFAVKLNLNPMALLHPSTLRFKMEAPGYSIYRELPKKYQLLISAG